MNFLFIFKSAKRKKMFTVTYSNSTPKLRTGFQRNMTGSICTIDPLLSLFIQDRSPGVDPVRCDIGNKRKSSFKFFFSRTTACIEKFNESEWCTYLHYLYL